MELYHAARAPARPFIVTPYRPGADGVMLPDEPSACPWAASGETCCLGVEHWRHRKTGPCHPLLVLGCEDHARAFTLYPCGHVPYGRALVAPVREDGALLSRPTYLDQFCLTEVSR